MTYEKREELSPILESQNQLHLTIYLENRGELADLKRQIEMCLSDAAVFLNPVLSAPEMETLLQPIRGLLDDGSILIKLKGNVGIFRSGQFFRVMSIPVDVKRSTHVASSFHVKPLLRWMQWDSDFMVLGLDSDGAYLYLGTQQTLRKLDSALFPNKLAALFRNEGNLSVRELAVLKEEAQKALKWVSEWINQTSNNKQIKLFVAGAPNIVNRFMRIQDYKGTVRAPVAESFSERKISGLIFQIRSLLRAQRRQSLRQALLIFQIADHLKKTEGNLEKISRAAMRGRVRKLIVAENHEIFGKINEKTGEVSVHPFDLDHEDDDILDDLAQKVLLAGGEVYLAKQQDIPSGRSILAILKSDKRKSAVREISEVTAAVG